MSSCFCFAFFTQADSTRLIENEAFSSNANNSPVMITHSPSFPPDHYILAVQVKTVVHPLLQKRSSLVSPLLKGAQRSLTWTQSDSKRISCFQMIHIHLCVSVTEPAHLTALFPLRARQAGFILCKQRMPLPQRSSRWRHTLRNNRVHFKWPVLHIQRPRVRVCHEVQSKKK